jgi:hypothetical protein
MINPVQKDRERPHHRQLAHRGQSDAAARDGRRQGRHVTGSYEIARWGLSVIFTQPVTAWFAASTTIWMALLLTSAIWKKWPARRLSARVIQESWRANEAATSGIVKIVNGRITRSRDFVCAKGMKIVRWTLSNRNIHSV